MSDKKIKISELPLAQTLAGLYTIGVDSLNKSVKVSLTWLKTASEGLVEAINMANTAASSASVAVNSANQAASSANTAADKANTAADKCKPPVIQKGIVKSGEMAEASVVANGTNANGNPVYNLNLTLPKGDNGKNPILETGTITTLAPGASVTASLSENGMNTDGAPKYKLNLGIPRGEKGASGDGAGNVLVNPAGLHAGKQYVFQPSSANSAEGTFVENIIKPNSIKDIQNFNSFRLVPVRFFNASPATGLVKITLPEQFVNTMWSVDLNIYDYGTGMNGRVYVSGYTYSGNKAWVKGSILALGFEREVRLGKDSNGNSCILLGTTSDYWNNLGISIDSIFTFGTGAKNIENDTTIEIITNETGITYSGSLFYNHHLFENGLNVFKPRKGLSAAQGKVLNDNKLEKSLFKDFAISEQPVLLSSSAELETNVPPADRELLLQSKITYQGAVTALNTVTDLNIKDFIRASVSFKEQINKARAAKDAYSLSAKVDKEPGKGLSTNDYTTTDKNKLAEIDLSEKVDKIEGKGLSANDFDNGYKGYLDFLSGSNDVATLADLPVSKRSINASLSAASVLSLSEALPEGRELMIRCTPSASFTQSLPASDVFSSMSGLSVQFTAGKAYEISIWAYKQNKYSIKIMEGE